MCYSFVMCGCTLSGIFDWYGGRWDRVDPLTDAEGESYPTELWCEAYVLARYPSRFPDGADHDGDIDDYDGQHDSSQDDGWEAPYVVHSPGIIVRTLAPWHDEERCAVVRNTVYELTLHADLLGNVDDWTVGTDATFDDGTDKLAVAGGAGDPTTDVKLTKLFTIISGDEGKYLTKIKASASGYTEIVVTFANIGGTGVDEVVRINLTSHAISGDADRAEYIAYLQEYWIRWNVTTPATPAIEIKVVDDGEDDITTPVEGAGVIITSCTLQWEELPPDESTLVELEEPFSDTPIDTFSYVGRDITLFDCSDGAKEIIWRRFIPAVNDYKLTGPPTTEAEFHTEWPPGSDIYISGDGTVLTYGGPSYWSLVDSFTIPNRRSTGLLGEGEGSVEEVDIHGTWDGHCLEGGTCAVNATEFHFYTGLGGSVGQKTEAIIIISDDGSGNGEESWFMGLANDGGNWTDLEYTSFLPNIPVDMGVVGTYDSGWDYGASTIGGATQYYQVAPIEQPVGEESTLYRDTKIPRLIKIYHRAAGQGQGAIVPLVHYHDDPDTGPPPVPGSFVDGFTADPNDPHHGFPWSNDSRSMKWYLTRDPLDYIALTAGAYGEENFDYGPYPKQWCFAGNDVELDTGAVTISEGTTLYGRDDIPIICGPREVLWEDSQSPDRVVYWGTPLGYSLSSVGGEVCTPPAIGSVTALSLSGPSTLGFHLMKADHALGGPTHAAIFTHYRDDITICGTIPWVGWEQLWGLHDHNPGLEPPSEIWENDNEPVGDPDPEGHEWDFASDPGLPYEIKDRRYWLTVVIGEPGERGEVGSGLLSEDEGYVIWEQEIFSKKAFARQRVGGLSALMPSGEEQGGYMFFEEIYDPDDLPRAEGATPAACALTGYEGETGTPADPGTYYEGTCIALKQWYCNNDGSVRYTRSIPVYSRPLIGPDVTSSSRNYIYLNNWPDWSRVDIATTEPETPVTIPISGSFDDCEIIYSTAGTWNADYIAVTVWIEHEHVGDLEVQLIAPGEAPIMLVSEQGDDGVNFTATRFLHEAPDRIPTVGTGDPFTGDWHPYESDGFSSIAGITATGDWIVQVRDTLASGRSSPVAGSFVKWKLELGSQVHFQWATSHDLDEDTGRPKYRWVPKADGGFQGWWNNQHTSPPDPEEYDPPTGYTLWDTNKNTIELSPALENLELED